MKMNLTRRNFMFTLAAGAVALSVRPRQRVTQEAVPTRSASGVCHFGSAPCSPPARPRTAAIEYIAMGDLWANPG